MRRNLLALPFIALSLLAAPVLYAQATPPDQTAAPATAAKAADITGVWRGQLDFGGDQPYAVVIHIAKGEDGKLTSWGENPQDGSNIPGSITFQDGKIHLDFDAGSFDGTLNDTGDAISGNFMVQGAQLPCQLKKDKPGI